jgi:hypothetical protein
VVRSTHDVGKWGGMAITVLRQDSRYDTLKRGHNLRWPATEADGVGRIEICETAEDAADANPEALHPDC